MSPSGGGRGVGGAVGKVRRGSSPRPHHVREIQNPDGVTDDTLTLKSETVSLADPRADSASDSSHMGSFLKEKTDH